MSSEKKDNSRQVTGLTRRQFLKGGATLSGIGLTTLGIPGCTYQGSLLEDYPQVPENRVSLPSNGKSVLILGGGFGGLHAACELLDRGFEVTLIEKSGMPGGKLKSWRETEFGVPPKDDPAWQGFSRDVGIHGVWGCYNNLREFMGRHAFSLFQFPNERISFYHFLDRDQTAATMLQPPPNWPGYLGDLQRYLDMIGAMEEMSGESIGIAHYLLRMMSFDFSDEKQRYYLDTISFPDWARSVGMQEKVIYRIMGPFAEMAMFDQINDASALSILTMMQLLFGSYEDMQIDLFPHPVGETYVAMLENYITQRGGTILYETPVVKLNTNNGKIDSVSAGDIVDGKQTHTWKCKACGEVFAGESKPQACPICGAAASQINALSSKPVQTYTADYYILAMDTHGARQIVSSSNLTGDSYFDNIMQLESTGVIVVNLWYANSDAWKRRFPEHWDFMPSGFKYLGFTLNWAADGVIGGERISDPYVKEYQPEHVDDNIVVIETQIADSNSVWGLDDEEIVSRVHEELKILMPDLPEPSDFYVNKWHTYSPQRVGFEALRPAIQSPIDNLLLIGDWVKTDHLSVYMEKTNVSAKLVTNLLLEKIGQPEGRIKILQSGTPNRIIETCKSLYSVYV
ncbi:MAG: FAD-dependent oxidoreductase [Pseudomonadota bacterium]